MLFRRHHCFDIALGGWLFKPGGGRLAKGSNSPAVNKRDRQPVDAGRPIEPSRDDQATLGGMAERPWGLDRWTTWFGECWKKSTA